MYIFIYNYIYICLRLQIHVCACLFLRVIAYRTADVITWITWSWSTWFLEILVPCSLSHLHKLSLSMNCPVIFVSHCRCRLLYTECMFPYLLTSSSVMPAAQKSRRHFSDCCSFRAVYSNVRCLPFLFACIAAWMYSSVKKFSSSSHFLSRSQLRICSIAAVSSSGRSGSVFSCASKLRERSGILSCDDAARCKSGHVAVVASPYPSSKDSGRLEHMSRDFLRRRHLIQHSIHPRASGSPHGLGGVHECSKELNNWFLHSCAASWFNA